MIARHTVSLPTSTSIMFWLFQRVYIIATVKKIAIAREEFEYGLQVK